MSGLPRSSALERFRPFTALQASSKAPLVIAGVLHAYDLMARPEGELVWYERISPGRFRLDLAVQRGLKPFAVASADDVPASNRSDEWRRLLRWKAAYRTYDLRRRTILLRLLATLSLFEDTETLTKGEPLTLDRPLDEVEAHYAFFRLTDQFMLHERKLLGKTAPLLSVARLAPAGSRLRVIAALKYLALNLEQAIVDDGVREAAAFARACVDELGAGVTPAEAFALESKYWRTVSYVPYLNGDVAAMDVQLENAEEFARRSLKAAKTGSDFDRGYAQENMYAVIATKAIAATHLDRPDAARGHYDRLIDLDPAGAWQRFGLARILLRQAEHEAALVQLKAGFHLAPPVLAEGWTLMAECLKALGRKTEAGVWERDAAARKPAVPTPPASRGGRA